MTTIVVTRLTKPQANYRDNILINPQFIISSSFSRNSKRKQRRRTNSSGATGITILSSPTPGKAKAPVPITQVVAPQPDPDDPKDEPTIEDKDHGDGGGWKWRFAKYSFPMQLAFIALFCAACFFEPNCCDGLNNFTWSLSPQLRYVQGPPPTWMPRGWRILIFWAKRHRIVKLFMVDPPVGIAYYRCYEILIQSGPLLVSTLWIGLSFFIKLVL